MTQAADTHYPTLHQPPLDSRPVAPHMRDYDAFCQSTSWDDARQALRLPRDNGINQATVCIDSHPEAVMQRTALIWVPDKKAAKPQAKLRSNDRGGAAINETAKLRPEARSGAIDETTKLRPEARSGADINETERYTFDDMRRQTNRFANVLTGLGIEKGDRVFVYLERIPEIFITLFGGLKTGAVVGPLFSAFGPEAIRDRLADSEAVAVVVSPALKPRLDSIRHELPALKHVIIVDRYNTFDASTLQAHEILYQPAMDAASDEFTVPYTAPEDYAIIHYTSGTTGKPKGAVHCHNAVIAQYATSKYILDFHPETDIYWCTADPGWVTGTSYGMFGPWSNGVTMVVYEGGFKAEDWYQVIQDYKVTVWYTAPTAIRMLMKAGESVPRQFDLSSLRHLCSVGEPLNPEAVIWGHRVFGHIFHDTWWQTETGTMHICNYPCMDVKPGSMGKPFAGVTAGIIDEDGNPLPTGEEGHLALRPDAPSFFRTYWKKEDMYQSRFRNGWYLTGDRARCDEDGYYWFIGRADDVINTAGHLVGPFEVESALIEHPAVAEAGVIGKPDAERLEIVKAFISLKEGYTESPELLSDIQQFVRTRLAAHAYPREIEVIAGLPKTRSGKIMRRLLKARELGLPEGDTSTLED